MSAAEKIKFEVGEAKFSVSHSFAVEAVIEHIKKRAGIPLPRFAANDIPAIGEVWPGQGGIYAGFVRGQDVKRGYHLIVPTDAAAYFKGKYGCYGTKIEGADHKRDGMANTQAMAAAGSDLAKKVLAMEIEGHRDLFIPAQCDLALCHINVPELFKKEWHLSSTQCSANLAWGQFFEDGGAGNGGKVNEFWVRVVRRLFE